MEQLIEMPVDRIRIANRFRKDMGALDELQASIEALGLLHPILVTKDDRLIDGERRVRAYQALGRDVIPTRMVDVPSLLRAEHDANELAKAFTVSERVAIGQALEAEIKAHGERRGRPKEGENPLLLPPEKNRLDLDGFPKGKRTDEIAAEQAGFGNKDTYRQAKAVVEYGIPPLVEALDSGRVSVYAAAEVAALPEPEQEEIVARGEKEILETAKRLRAEKAHRTKFTGENEWYTPAEYVDHVRAVLTTIDLDAASSELAQETVQARAYFSLEDDALTQDWSGRVFLNPPYSQPLISQFIDKLLTEIDAGTVDAAITLTHNYTDTAWFQKLAHAAHAVCFTRGRVRFISALGDIAAPTQGQAFCYFGPDVDRFTSIFAAVGVVMEVRR